MKKYYTAIITRKRNNTTVDLYYDANLSEIIVSQYYPDKSPYKKSLLKNSPFNPKHVRYNLTDDILKFAKNLPRYSSPSLSDKILNLLEEYFDNAKSSKYNSVNETKLFEQLITSLRSYHPFFKEYSHIYLERIIDSHFQNLLFTFLWSNRNQAFSADSVQILPYINMYKNLFFPFEAIDKNYTTLAYKRIVSSYINEFTNAHTFSSYTKTKSIYPEIDNINTLIEDYFDYVESAEKNRIKSFNFFIYQHNYEITKAFTKNFHLYSDIELASQLSLEKINIDADKIDEEVQKDQTESFFQGSYAMYEKSELYPAQKKILDNSNSPILEQDNYFSTFLPTENLFKKLGNTIIFQFTDLSQLLLMELSELNKDASCFKLCKNCGLPFPIKSNAQKLCLQCSHKSTRQQTYDKRVKDDPRKKEVRRIKNRYSTYKSRTPSYAKEIDSLKMAWEEEIKEFASTSDTSEYIKKLNDAYMHNYPNSVIKKK